MKTRSHGGSAVPSVLPVIPAPMAGGPTTPQLVAAVSAAGGFGFLAAGYLSVDSLAATITRTRELTDAPFGVNVFVPADPDADDAAIAAYAETLRPESERLGTQPGPPLWDDDAFDGKVTLLLDAGVHTVGFTFGRPERDVVDRLHDKGIRVAVTVTNAAEARAADGADVLVVQGTEAGGHQGTFDARRRNEAALLDALTEVRAATTVPLVAAGGIMTRADADTAMDAGASAVQIGTALLCADEAGTSSAHRDALLSRRYDDTVLTRAFSGRWARGLANRFALDHLDAPPGYPQVHHVTRPLRTAAAKTGDPDVVNLWAGTGWRAATQSPARDIVAGIAPRTGGAR